MKLGVLLESVFLRVNGGKPSTDNSVLRADIRALLPAAINYAMDAAYNINIKSEGDRDLPTEFYGSYDDVPIVRTGKKPSFSLQKGTVPLKGNAGIRSVYDDCDNYYAPLTDSDMPTIKHYGGISTGTKWYRRKGQTVELYNVNPVAEVINYQAITNIESLSDTDEAPIQAGQEPIVMDLLYQWITGQKQNPYDSKIDARDDINASQYK